MTAGLELTAGAARVALAPETGGAIASYECHGLAILRSAAPGALASHDARDFASYPLIPFSNRIANATLRWEGSTYRLQRYLAGHPHAIHGNGWQRQWSVVRSASDCATLELVHDPTGPHQVEWPFPYRARQTFALSESALAMGITIENTGSFAFPFGVGWHPFFPRTKATLLSFYAASVWHTDATQLPLRLEGVPDAWDFSAPRAIGDTALDHCFTGWRSRARLCWPERNLSASIVADDTCTYLIVYIPRDSDYLAIEPVTHMTDAFNRASAGESGTGTRVLAPGQTFSCTMQISISSASRDAPGV